MSLSSLSTPQELLKLRAGSDKLEHLGAVKMVKTHLEICTVKYISEGQARMIDLKTELEAPLATKAIKGQHES